MNIVHCLRGTLRLLVGTMLLAGLCALIAWI
jgi:hypothetical protein